MVRKNSFCFPGLWNIQYNTTLNLNFIKRTTVVEFADDHLLVIRGVSVRESKT